MVAGGTRRSRSLVAHASLGIFVLFPAVINSANPPQRTDAAQRGGAAAKGFAAGQGWGRGQSPGNSLGTPPATSVDFRSGPVSSAKNTHIIPFACLVVILLRIFRRQWKVRNSSSAHRTVGIFWRVLWFVRCAGTCWSLCPPAHCPAPLGRPDQGLDCQPSVVLSYKEWKN